MTQRNLGTYWARTRAGLIGAAVASSACVLAMTACSGSTVDGPDGSGGLAGSGGSPSGSGGAISGTGGTGGTSPGTGGAPAGSGGALGGAGGEGGAGDVCSLPFEVGDCDAAIPVYFHNAATGRCQPAVYGGCGGNDNRFESFTECENACGVVPTGQACQVDDIVYPDGWSNVPDPTSCNSCACVDGRIDMCTDIACEEPCEEGTVRATDCTACGPTDACLVVRTGCLPECDDQNECTNGGLCSGGVCRLVCG